MRDVYTATIEHRVYLYIRTYEGDRECCEWTHGKYQSS